ncbi:pentatricopeptide repeat-containing At5g02830, chloroplastic [Olea europaea subsp. europaea]|uniref:Pentatricopeptide repeat-containing At5g02830, chloroplastic n=1 Tax=Olea europaea subsp. europaea TaxID=158383 RepID=A0A8S0R1C5_OLEEU|nr:pentatricopeptide repeat-containing At5g02830, chloroplastic [Olea europaea subsp. europaea]
MGDPLSILASSTVVPAAAAAAASPRRRHHHHHFPSSSSAATTNTTKPKPKHTSKSFTTSPLLSNVRGDNRENPRYYAELASKLAEDGRFEDFLMIAEIMVVSGLKGREFVSLLNAKAVSSGITRMLDDGKVKSVVELILSGFMKLAIDPIQLFDGAAIEALKRECYRVMKLGEVEQIVSLMDTLHGFHFPIRELVEPSDIIKLCISKRNPTAAIRYACMFPHVQILICTIILGFGKKGDLVSALIAFEASKQSLGCPNMHVYRTIIDVCGLCGNYLKSRIIYEELLACKVIPNTHVFNSLMNVNASDLNYALNIYKKMQELDVTHDIASYNILLKSCCLAANVDLAQDIYREVQCLESKGTLKLDVFTYSTMIKVFADAKMWKPALEIKEDMLSAGVTPNTVTWSSLISACASAGLVEQALKLLDEMLQDGGKPNTQCFNNLLHACVEACQYDRAFRLFQSWKGGNTAKDVVSELTSQTCNASRSFALASSCQSRLTMKVPFRPTTSTYNILLKACGSDYYRAKHLMDEMKTLGLSPNHISWSILIDICGSSGNVEGAMKILRSMREGGIQPDVVTYTTAIKVCVEHKDMKLAFSLFAEMKKYQIRPNLVTYNTLLRARRRYGSLQEVQKCLAVYQDMRKAGYKPNDYYLKQLIEEWCEGVIQDSSHNEGRFTSRRTDFGPHSLLLEKVAEHLQESNVERLSIDLQGLTKVEARIVVLAVLRMIKEKYSTGDSIKDDMLLILSVQEIGACVGKDEIGVKEAVIKLLQYDLGLQVISRGSRIGNNKKSDVENPVCSNLKLEDLKRSGPSPQLESPTRRPVVLQRLKITKESLHHWLQRKTAATIK